MSGETQKKEKVLHLQGKWCGVKMGWAACNTPVPPFAKNLTPFREKATCKKCRKMAQASGETCEKK